MPPAPQSKPQPAEFDEPRLIAQTRAGDPSALGALYDRHAATLMAVAYRLLQSTPDAEDVVHDVFVGLPEALRRYEERGAFSAWLKTVTARVALARMRESAVLDVVPLEGAAEPIAPQRDIADGISLDAAVRALAPTLRAVLVLKEIEGFSHGDIAKLLDISVGASEVRLHRAIRALRAALTPTKEQR
jgi:RNA polymerase sigma factor (sigma-70 family)